MTKYIIDLPDDTTCINALKYEDGKCVAARVYIISDLTPYTEPDKEQIENEVWNLVKTITYMGYDEFVSCFGDTIGEPIYELSYSEVKAKYEAWKKQIRVGDEVEFGGAKGLVYIVGEEMLEGAYLNCDGLLPFCWRKKDCRKTGKHFPEIAELLMKIRGDILTIK